MVWNAPRGFGEVPGQIEVSVRQRGMDEAEVSERGANKDVGRSGANLAVGNGIGSNNGFAGREMGIVRWTSGIWWTSPYFRKRNAKFGKNTSEHC